MTMNEAEQYRQPVCAIGTDTPSYAPITSLKEALFDGNDDSLHPYAKEDEAGDSLVCWFPLRIRHSNFKKAFATRDALFDMGFTTYLRLNYHEEIKSDELTWIVEPALSNLIFVRSKKKIIRSLKHLYAPFLSLQFVTRPRRDSYGRFLRNDVITVGDTAMQRFIDTETRDDPRQQRVQLRYEDYLAKPGRKVRIIRGPFAGIYGEIKTIKSHRVVVVKLPELKIANGITHVSKSDLVILEDETMPSRSTSAI